MFLISKRYRSSLWHKQPPAWWTPEALFQGVKGAGVCGLGSWCRQVPRLLFDYRPALNICKYLNSPTFGNFFPECIQLLSNAYSQNRAVWGLQLSTYMAYSVSQRFLTSVTFSLLQFPLGLTLPSPFPSHTTETLCESAARLLFMNVKWAKNVPAFTSLNLNDQVSGMP